VIGLIDYGAGNLRNVQNALDRLGVVARVALGPEDLRGIQAIIFPGVGAAAPAMAALRGRDLVDPIREAIQRGVPFLGICLGLQLLFESSTEDGAGCLDVLSGTVQRLPTAQKLPHIGWNTIEPRRPHPILEGIAGEAVYFVHSFVAAPADPSLVVAETEYGARFPSVIARDRLVAVQFHPERSGRVGFRLLENFLRLAEVSAAA